jgi:hypothetical protein
VRTVADWAALYLALLAAGAHPTPGVVLIAFGAATVAGMIPLTPGGLQEFLDLARERGAWPPSASTRCRRRWPPPSTGWPIRGCRRWPVSGRWRYSPPPRRAPAAASRLRVAPAAPRSRPRRCQRRRAPRPVSPAAPVVSPPCTPSSGAGRCVIDPSRG